MSDITALRARRIAAHKSQYETAKTIGMDRTRLSLAECGHIILRPDEMAQLEAFLLQATIARSDELRAIVEDLKSQKNDDEVGGADRNYGLKENIVSPVARNSPLEPNDVT
jgi:transcriptional regulator with XRE-family HTH domain